MKKSMSLKWIAAALVFAHALTFSLPAAWSQELTVQHGSVNEWDSFNVGENQHAAITVVDEVGNAMADGRAVINVLQDYASQIYGNLDINGIIAILNANGFDIGPNANLNVVGGLILSTLGISEADFFAGMTALNQASHNPGFISNQGHIHVDPGSFLALVAGAIKNTGTIAADGGTAILAAGKEGTLSVGGDGLVAVAITKKVDAEVFDFEGNKVADQIDHSGLTHADGGMVKLTAKGAEEIFDSIINHSGMISAKSVSIVNGEVILDGGEEGIVSISGDIDASGKNDSEKGGSIQILGDKIGLFDGAKVDASGNTGGGTVLVGGDYQGKNPEIRNASRVYLATEAEIRADALQNGNGGKIIVWSDYGTQVYGSLSARGGAVSGSGGFIETSSLSGLDIRTSPDVSAFNGLGGTWLIDPYNIEIVAGSGNTNINGASPFESNGNSAQLGVGLIVTGLGNGNVVISTGAGGAQAGNILWTADMDFDGIGTERLLTLNAHNDITLNGSISQTGADDQLSITFNADSDSNGGGAIIINDNISTGGGAVTFQDGTYLAGNIDTSTAQAARAGGNITFQGAVIIAKNDGVSLTTTGVTGDGAVAFQGTLDSGNSYSYDATARTWNAARTAAASGTGASVGDTYLATVTSALENSIATSTSSNNQAWLGGSDSASEGDWRWVTGPEGLENAGAGRPFWSGAAAGSAVGGAYENWNDSEPNDSGGNEDALQLGFGTQGQWNDLPSASSTLGSIVETNLSSTDLTITAGTGSVSFGGVIGANKALGDLTIASGGAVSFSGAATISEDVSITNSGVLSTAAAADMTVTGFFTHAGTGTASLAGDITTTNQNILFNRNVTLTGNSAFSTGAGGAGDITFLGTLNGANTLSLTAGTGNIAFNTGIGNTTPITGLTVNSAAATSFNNATSSVAGSVAVSSGNINLNEALTTTSGGTVTMTPSGTLFTDTDAPINSAGAFTLNGTGNATIGADITTTNGSITLNRAIAMNTSLTFTADGASSDVTIANNITKSAGTDAVLTVRADDAILITSGADITSSSGELDIILNSDRDASQAGNINIGSGSVLTSNNGEIVLSGGTGTTTDLKTSGYAYGTSAGGTNNRGLYIDGATLNSGTGDITLRGTGASLNAVTNQGVDIVGSSVVESSSGNITINGVAGNGLAQPNQMGAVVYNGSRVSTTTTGNISITGTANNSGTGEAQRGVTIQTNAVVRANGSGTITLTGSGGTSGDLTDNYGVNIIDGSRVEGAGSGSIIINGTAGASSVSIYADGTSTIGEGAFAGVYSGDVSLTGDSMNFSGAAIETTGDVSLQNSTAGRLIRLGSNVNNTANSLELSETELDGITADNLTIGNTSSGNVIFSNQITPNNVDRLTVVTGGSMNGSADDGTADIVANKLTLTANSGGIGATTPIDVTITSAFSADTSVDNGNIAVDSIGDLPVELINAGSGTVTLNSTGKIDDHAVDSLIDIISGILNISAAGGISTVRALELQFPRTYIVTTPYGGNVLEVGDDILDDPDNGETDFENDGPVTLKARRGIIGTLDNPIEVLLSGPLSLFAGGERNGLSIVLNGTFLGMPEFLNIPTGLVLINGAFVGGLALNELKTANSELYGDLLVHGANQDTQSGSGYLDFPGIASYADWQPQDGSGNIDDTPLQYRFST